jgi:hypothetical protein
MHQALKDMTVRNIQEVFNDALYYRDETRRLFQIGQISLRQRSLAEQLFWATISEINRLSKELKHVSTELTDLDRVLSDFYYCNFSVFQSLPDSWAIGQLFPVMPIHRLNEEPTRKGILADITCDCDGKIDQFIDKRGVKRYLPLHELKPHEEYILGAFLVGAYQETLGDLHNLLGDTNVVTIRIQDQGEFDFVTNRKATPWPMSFPMSSMIPNGSLSVSVKPRSRPSVPVASPPRSAARLFRRTKPGCAVTPILNDNQSPAAGETELHHLEENTMAHVLIIGAGGVGSVVTHKCAQVSEVFSTITLASRTLAKCTAIAAQVKERTGIPVAVEQVDADNVAETVALIKRLKPDLVLNVALPYQDLPLMDACLETGVDYLDTANYEPPDEAKFEYKWQWAYRDRFAARNIMALLGSGFDPGVTNVFCAWAQKHHFDEIHQLDIIDCNAGDHGQAFATNFNPEINIREITQRGRYWEHGEWVETDPLSWSMTYDFPEGHRTEKMFSHVPRGTGIPGR